MTLDPDLTDHITVHTDRKNGTLYVLLVDEIDDETLDEHANRMAAMAGDASTADEFKDDLVQRALHETLKTDVPEAFDPSTPTTVNINTDRDVEL